ncbi:MAG: hypothetical protein FJ028_10545 [Chloroflexi bacterium]|nr:hypothetical protein [Chloroflexota bacterium]
MRALAPLVERPAARVRRVAEADLDPAAEGDRAVSEVDVEEALLGRHERGSEALSGSVRIALRQAPCEILRPDRVKHD